MKIFFTLLSLMLITGCTSLKPVEMHPPQLQQTITKDAIIKVGSEVKIYTSDGENHEFEVLTVSETHITGENISIEIKDIVALETREFSGGKTTFLVGSLSVLLYYIVAAIALASAIGL